MKRRAPRILQIGMGRFGREHWKTWTRLEEAGQVDLVGVAVRTESSARRLAEELQTRVEAGLPASLLARADAVDIVTPSSSHAALAARCLERADVLVEKPLAATVSEARELEALARRARRVLMVNHLYRFHPVTRELVRCLERIGTTPALVRGAFTNPHDEWRPELEVNLELLHFFDVLDRLFAPRPLATWAEERGRARQVDIQYEEGLHALLRLGFEAGERVRKLELEWPDRKLRADFREHIVTETKRGEMTRTIVPAEPRPLEAALRAFLDAREASGAAIPDARVGRRMVALALDARPAPMRKRPTVAVVGGGIFGATCALELARFCDVTLMERHPELLDEASFGNQWRHHSGFHYPRSQDTIDEIREARDAFVSVYGDAVSTDVPSYYCTAAEGQEVTRERYLAVCEQNGLEYRMALPPAGILDTNRVSLSLLTDEAILDFYAIRAMLHRELPRAGVELLLEASVESAAIQRDGSKRLVATRGARQETREYDFVINATYANNNLLASWLGLPTRSLRFDLCEMLVVRVPAPKMAITVLDGPFTSLLSTGEPGLFTLSHIHQSILQSVVTPNGLPPRWKGVRSNRENLLRHGLRYFPILEDAEVVESRYSTRAVCAYNEDYDGRPTVVTRHGFGCWSVLGGKIVTCVTNAREISSEIRAILARGEPGVDSRTA